MAAITQDMMSYIYMQHNKKSYETENDYLIFTNKIVIYGNVSWNV